MLRPLALLQPGLEKALLGRPVHPGALESPGGCPSHCLHRDHVLLVRRVTVLVSSACHICLA